MTAGATYVYCIVSSRQPLHTTNTPQGPPGTAAVRALEIRPERYLIVSDAPLAEYGEASLSAKLSDLEWVSRAAVAHEAVTQSFMMSSPPADAVVPRTQGGYHPLCAAYTRACLEPIARRLAGRQLKTIDLMMDVRTRIVTPEELDRFGGERKLLANINTPAEYAGLAALHDHIM